MDEAYFQSKLDELSVQSHNQGRTANDLIDLIVNFPHRSHEVVDLVSHALIDWNFSDLRNLWCALIITHDELGKNTLTFERWNQNCRNWLNRQAQLTYECDKPLSKLAVGYGSAKHAFNSIEMILDQAQRWGGYQAKLSTAQKLAHAALAHALDGRDELGPELLDKLMSLVKMNEVGDLEKMPWVFMWAAVAADGLRHEGISPTLGVMTRNGVDIYQRDKAGRQVWDWLAEQSHISEGVDWARLAHISAALLNEGWPLDRAKQCGLHPQVWNLLQRHPVVLRERLMALAGSKEEEQGDGEDRNILM